MARLTIATPEREIEIPLKEDTFEPLVRQLHIVSPLLAAKIEDAAHASASLQLNAEELEYLGTAAAVVDKGGRVNDPGLRLLAML
jgi:hypothetical protein